MALNAKDGDGAAVVLKTTIDTSEHVQHVKVDTSALPTGAATSAAQTTGNNSLASIESDAALIKTATQDALTLANNSAGGTYVRTQTADDTAVAGPLFTGAGLVLDAVTDLVTGRAGRVRISPRRGVIVSPDGRTDSIGSDAVPGAGLTDVTCNTTDSISGASAPTTAFFNGADGGFGDAARYVYIPMAATASTLWESIRISIFDNLDTATVYTLYGLTLASNDTSSLSGAPVVLDVVTLGGTSTTQQSVTFGVLDVGAAGATAAPGSTGGNYYRTVPALAAGWDRIAIKIDPTGDPTSGGVRLRLRRSNA
jgi:hypothetical protein